MQRAGANTRAVAGIRAVLVVGYLGLIAFGLLSPWQPRVFWTMLLPLLPVAIVLMGFPMWRRVCPLAAFGEVGRRLNRRSQHKVPAWMERSFLVISFGFLLAMLALRLVATNGDPVWLAGLLAALALAALVTNRVFTGRTWCNFLCPVGLVERIYTEPNSLVPAGDSRCTRCTACKRHCPDIDQENAYWRDLMSTGRRVATYSFPGLVFGFYWYYWLRAGDWEAYFDGRWTRLPVSEELVLGSGFFFAPGVPAIVAAPLSLVVVSAASFVIFAAIERAVTRLVPDAERRRHVVLALAAFAAFNLFYAYAGAPSLRLVDGGTRTVAFAAPLVATLFLAKRWRRTREHFIGERGATRLLNNWPFDEAPPEDPGEVYAWIKAGEHAREQQLEAYASTVRQMIADGLIGSGEMRFLEGVRKQLGVTEREHERILQRLSIEERELFTGGGVAERAQLQGYEAALTEALLRRASEAEVGELREAFGVDEAGHRRVLERIRGESGKLRERARLQLEQALFVRADLRALGGLPLPGPLGFLTALLLKAQAEAVDAVLESLEAAGDRDRIRSIRPRLAAEDAEDRRAAISELAGACPANDDVVRELAPLLIDPRPRMLVTETEIRERTLARLAAARSPFLRAGAVWAAASHGRDFARPLVERALTDSDDLVRETVEYVQRTMTADTEEEELATGLNFVRLATIERMDLLRCVPIFAELAPEDLHDLATLTEEEAFSPDAPLCEEGATDADDVFVLIEGQAVVEVRGDDGNPHEVAVVGVGEVVGELSFLDSSPRSATVRPKDAPLRVLRISGNLFRHRLLARPQVAQPLLRTLAERLRNASRRVAAADRRA